MTINITMTDAARVYIKKMIKQNNGIGLRLSIKKTGCSGYAYVPTIVRQLDPSDMSLEFETDLTLSLDRNWVSLLDNLNIDYVEEDKTGLKQKRLVFSNPNEGARCGCGESFHIE